MKSWFTIVGSAESDHFKIIKFQMNLLLEEQFFRFEGDYEVKVPAGDALSNIGN